MDIKFGNLVEADERIIVHQVNCCGVMGAGVARAIRNKWPKVFESYHRTCKKFEDYELIGKTLPVAIDDKLILNVFGQRLYGYSGRYTEYPALRQAFASIAERYPNEKIAMPYGIGCGLAGGDWEVVSNIIEEIFGDNAVLYKLDKNN